MPQILVQNDRDKIEQSDSDDEASDTSEHNVVRCILVMPCYINAKYNCRKQKGGNPQQHREDIADGVPPLKIGIGIHEEISSRFFRRKPLIDPFALRGFLIENNCALWRPAIVSALFPAHLK